jgi:hypothetical protein
MEEVPPSDDIINVSRLQCIFPADNCMTLRNKAVAFLSYNDGKIGVGAGAANTSSAKVPSNFSIFVIAFFMPIRI